MRKHFASCWRQAKRMLKFTLFRIIEYSGPPTFAFISWAHGARMVVRQPSGKPHSSRIQPGYTGPRRTCVPVLRLSVCPVSRPSSVHHCPPLFPLSSSPHRASRAPNPWNSPLLGWVTRASSRSRLGTGRLGQWVQGPGNLYLRPRERESGPLHRSCCLGLIHKITSEGKDHQALCMFSVDETHLCPRVTQQYLSISTRLAPRS